MTLILGVGMVKVDRHYTRTLRELALEASMKALADADVDDVDYIVLATSLSYLQSPQLDQASYLASYLGLRGAKAIVVESGESSGLAALETATALIKSGIAKRVLVVGYERMSDHDSETTYSHLQLLYDAESDAFYNIGHAGVAGILMRLYMERYEVDRITMAYWPALMHKNAKENPYAMLRFAVTPDKVASAMPIADPITLLDSYPLGDGAAALVVSSELAGGSSGARASIKSIGSATGFPSVALREDPLFIESLREAASAAGLTGDTLKRMDLMEVHDSFTITAYMILETLGLADRGKAAKLVADGKLGDGEPPYLNPSGGLKARGHPVGATDVYKVAEAALQLSGDFPGVKVDGARLAGVISINGHGSSARVAVLGVA